MIHPQASMSSHCDGSSGSGCGNSIELWNCIIILTWLKSLYTEVEIYNKKEKIYRK